MDQRDRELIQTPDYVRRFLEKVAIDESTGCWEWSAARNYAGYGKVRVGSKHARAHRVAYEMYIGDIPDKAVVRHECDNPGCVNPAHLLVGTQADNISDKVKKGRQAIGRGNAAAKLTEKQVREIRRLSESMSYRDIAARFGISLGSVHKVVHRITWANVE